MSDPAKPRDQHENKGSYPPRVCFADGKRKIDYVLVYETNDYTASKSKDKNASKSRREKKEESRRKNFEKNLTAQGLELEYVSAEVCLDTHYVLIHAPFRVLAKEAERLSLKMPLRDEVRVVRRGKLDRLLNGIFKFALFDRKTNERLHGKNYFTAPFSASLLDCYVGSENRDTFFDSAERSRLVYSILTRTKHLDSKKMTHDIGIEQMIRAGCYTAAYPIHDDYGNEQEKDYTDRDLLNKYWASSTQLLKHQPLTLIKKYFGSRLAWYFAFIGYYTYSLIPLSLIGIICFIYGLATKDTDIPTNDVCNKNGVGNKILMCPLCDTYCDFTFLSSSCMHSRLLHIFDNEASVVFAAVMSIYVTLFLEYWRRYQAKLAWVWGLLDFEVDEENMRPEYRIAAQEGKKKRLNPVTQREEPYIPYRLRFFKHLVSAFIVLFCILAVILVDIFMMLFRFKFSQWMYTKEAWKPYVNIVTTIVAATIQLIIAFWLGSVYKATALQLTIWECPRTQQDFDNNYAIKNYLFEFVNFYSSLFYIAFVKGSLTTIPGHHIWGFRPEECEPLGCMVELVIQLLIIMLGNQLWRQTSEHIWPYVVLGGRLCWLTKRDSRIWKKKKWSKQMTDETARWERDYVLYPSFSQHMFYEYLTLVIQLGFVTFFVAALPLAPLLALISNLFEIRFDAQKYVRSTRRQMPEHARNIGIWFQVLDMISRFAPLVNACIIAFTSDFIPRLVYVFFYSKDGTLNGFTNNSLSYFDASEIHIEGSRFRNSVEVCRYRAFRYPPCTIAPASECDNAHGYSAQWWIVVAFRVIFVLLFEEFLSLLKSLIAYLIPDIPHQVLNGIQRERYLARQARISTIRTSRTASETGSQTELLMDRPAKIQRKNAKKSSTVGV